MMKKNDKQLNFFDKIIFDQLIPKDHLLVKIDEAFDFSFLYDCLKLKYKDCGRGSKDPVMMIKALLLEFIYGLSDVEVSKRIQTDIAFRWFLGLTMNDTGPDDTTLSHFRTQRLDDTDFEELFNQVVGQCIDKNLVKTRRYIVDSTNVDANVNYPSDKKLLRQAANRLAKEIKKFNGTLGEQWLNELETTIQKLYGTSEKVSAKAHYKIARKMLAELYCKTYDQLQENDHYIKAYTVCYELIEKYLENKKDKIISIVDPEARVAYKSPGNAKTGYKNHIIMDEDSEIILGSVQTPFNVGDQKKLLPLVEQVENNFDLKPLELSADKVYGTTKIRADLKDKDIISNINFSAENGKKSDDTARYKTEDFIIAEDVLSMTCPQKITTTSYRDFKIKNEEDSYPYRQFTVDKRHCNCCPQRERCLNKKEKSKRIRVYARYDAIKKDKERIQSPEFEVAMNMRFKIERRFGTQVNHRSGRRSRYLGMKRTAIQINIVNTVTNIIRAINIIESFSESTA